MFIEISRELLVLVWSSRSTRTHVAQKPVRAVKRKCGTAGFSSARVGEVGRRSIQSAARTHLFVFLCSPSMDSRAVGTYRGAARCAANSITSGAVVISGQDVTIAIFLRCSHMLIFIFQKHVNRRGLFTRSRRKKP